MNQDLGKPVTKEELHKELGDFTDEVIMPGVERTVKQTEERLERKIDMTQNSVNIVLEQLKRMQEAIDRIENRQEKGRLEVKVIDWLCKRVDVLERKLGVEPESIPRD